MSVVLEVPGVQELGRVRDTLQGWQHDNAPLQLHPGDLGWYSLRGPAATAAAVRTWSRNGDILAIGLLDGPQLLRMAFDPVVRDDDELARKLVADVGDPQRGVLDAGSAAIEARGATRFAQMPAEDGWQADEPWTPFHLDPYNPPADAGPSPSPLSDQQAQDARDFWSR